MKERYTVNIPEDVSFEDAERMLRGAGMEILDQFEGCTFDARRALFLVVGATPSQIVQLQRTNEKFVFYPDI